MKDIDLSSVIYKYHKSGAAKSQRLGQYFINQHVPSEDLPWPELFYEKDDDTCIRMMVEYVHSGLRRSESNPWEG